MQTLFQIATVELASFLENCLPEFSADWWNENVFDNLSFQQQRFVEERGYNSLKQLDFAALLRVLDRNWYDISNSYSFPPEGRSWVKELQTVRNKWAHLSSEEIPKEDLFRDADTLERLLKLIGASEDSLEKINEQKQSIISIAFEKRSELNNTTDLVSNATALKADVDSNKPKFERGDLVSLRSNTEIKCPILEVIPGYGECRYKVFQDSRTVTYYESQLQRFSESETTQEILDAEKVKSYLTNLQILSPSINNLFSLRQGRIQFVPYQYRPVLKLIRSDRPRLLIADEVGVGKTIEAGLIIKELQARMDISSILIICPRTLVTEKKWYYEMKRFDESFTSLDSNLLRHCLHELTLDDEWPKQYSKVIMPFSLFDKKLLFGNSNQNKRNREGLLSLSQPPKFDLVIVDEAHHIRNSDTCLHQGIRYFCDNAEAVIFLTATPVQLGRKDLNTLLNVLRPDLIIDSSSFDMMAEPNRYINEAAQHCRRGENDWNKNALACLNQVAQTAWGSQFIRESSEFQRIYDNLHEENLTDADRVQLIRSIEELYTFSSLINRTRRRDIGEFTVRKPETIEIECTPSQKELHDTLLDLIQRMLAYSHDNSNISFMMTMIRRQVASCFYGLVPLFEDMLNGRLNKIEYAEAIDGDYEPDPELVSQFRSEIKSLIVQAQELDPYDPKLEAFIKVIEDKNTLPNNKILLFSTFRHTLAYLAKNVENTTLRYGLIHGDVPDDERAEIRHRFGLPKEDPLAIDILLSSEVGCEGLDFQFCDFLINYDLPWNPMRIEQRIGRIDRYGQKSESVAIVNFITSGTIEAEIYNRCLVRIGVFEHSIGGSEEILGDITREIHQIAERYTLTNEEMERRLRQLSDNMVRRIQEEQELESKEAELIGLNIPKSTWLQDIESAESYWLSPEAIQRSVTCYLKERLGREGEYLLGEKAVKTLRVNKDGRAALLQDYIRIPHKSDPTFRMWEKWLKGDNPVFPVTFDQEAATEDEKITHLSVLHPLIKQAASYQEHQQVVYTALTIQDTELSPGQYPFGVYHWKKQGVKPDDVIVPVATDPILEEKILSLLQTAEGSDFNDHIDSSVFDVLEKRHYTKWIAARAKHIDENRQQVEYRIQSLKASHKSRRQVIENQLKGTANNKIQIMKTSELARAEQDFELRMKDLEKDRDSGDITAEPVVFGLLINL